MQSHLQPTQSPLGMFKIKILSLIPNPQKSILLKKSLFAYCIFSFPQTWQRTLNLPVPWYLGTCQYKRLKSNSGQTLWSSENKSRHSLSCQRCFHHPTIFSIEDKLTPILNKRWREEQKETATLSKDIIWVHFHLKCEEYRSSLRSFHFRHNLT